MKETNVLKTRSRRMSEERPAEPSPGRVGTSRLDPSSGWTRAAATKKAAESLARPDHL